MNAKIIYWSQTGNTEDIAKKISKDTQIEYVRVSNITASEAINYDTLILGCPAMGAEELEEDEFRPFFDELKTNLSNQRLFLFGSYGWGGGEWMQNWEQEVKEAGLNLSCEGLISNSDSSDLDSEAYEKFINTIKA